MSSENTSAQVSEKIASAALNMLKDTNNKQEKAKEALDNTMTKGGNTVIKIYVERHPDNLLTKAARGIGKAVLNNPVVKSAKMIGKGIGKGAKMIGDARKKLAKAVLRARTQRANNIDRTVTKAKEAAIEVSSTMTAPITLGASKGVAKVEKAGMEAGLKARTAVRNAQEKSMEQKIDGKTKQQFSDLVKNGIEKSAGGSLAIAKGGNVPGKNVDKGLEALIK